MNIKKLLLIALVAYAALSVHMSKCEEIIYINFHNKKLRIKINDYQKEDISNLKKHIEEQTGIPAGIQYIQHNKTKYENSTQLHTLNRNNLTLILSTHYDPIASLNTTITSIQEHIKENIQTLQKKMRAIELFAQMD